MAHQTWVHEAYWQIKQAEVTIGRAKKGHIKDQMGEPELGNYIIKAPDQWEGRVDY